MSNQDITDQTLPTDAQAPVDGAAAVQTKIEAPVNPPAQDTLAALSLEELEKTLGKKFPSKESALKSIKDTYDFVGAKTRTSEEELRAKGYITTKELEDALFFRDNPSHEANRAVLEAIAKSKNISFKEAASDPAYSTLYEKASNFDKTESLKSVVESNPRLASVQTRAKTVAEHIKSGNKEAAEREAARAVAEAFDLK